MLCLLVQKTEITEVIHKPVDPQQDPHAIYKQVI
jgi:hypothetical protein